MSKLIILRGPCGAGKSTVAKTLMKRVSAPTALIERDYFMFMFNTQGNGHISPDRELIGLNILYCLEHGFDVIFEGNFKPSTHDKLLDNLFNKHPNDNYVFYLDVSLDETLKRHDTRKQIISSEDMRRLYKDAVPLGLPNEIVIPEHSSLEATISLIQKTAGI